MVSIASYLKQGSELVPIAEFHGPIADENYIEGAIELSINYVPLLTTAQVDYVDQLWAYLIQGMVENVREGQPFKTYFPDCPIEVTLRPEPGERIAVGVDLRTKRGPITATAPLAEFKRVFAAEARRFFETLMPLVSDHRSTYERLLEVVATKATLTGLMIELYRRLSGRALEPEASSRTTTSGVAHEHAS
jgi:hypothetical protein